MSDQDARPTGGSHPFAHLWDNGKDAAKELNRVMQIRKQVLENFGDRNIKDGTPMASLEEVLVPMYFFHRYQLEATSKLIGGLNYRYALKGDGQPVTEFVSGAQQREALDELLKTISPEALMLPEKLLKQIPPRPLGYSRTRELIKLRTDLTFDALGAAESASDLAVSLLLHPARASRLVEYHARNEQQPSLDMVLDRLINSAVLNKPATTYASAVQMTVNDVVLNNLFKLAVNNASSIVKGVTLAKLESLRIKLTTMSASEKDFNWKAHYVHVAKRISDFQSDPAEFKVPDSLPTPPGQPIGTELSCSN